MPIITKKDIDEEYLNKYLITAIMPNGIIVALNREGVTEQYHEGAFKLLVKEIEKVLDINLHYKTQMHSNNNLMEFNKRNIIPITPYYIGQKPYIIKNDMQIIKFPRNTTKKQLYSMKNLLVALKDVGYIEFVEEGADEKDANVGIEELEIYINNKIKELEEKEEER